jgi:hypothetical protein
MYIEGIDHIQLAMPAGQEETARVFYSGILEIPEVPKPPELAKRGGVWFESDQVKVHLGIDPNFAPPKGPSGISDSRPECACMQAP